MAKTKITKRCKKSVLVTPMSPPIVEPLTPEPLTPDDLPPLEPATPEPATPEPATPPLEIVEPPTPPYDALPPPETVEMPPMPPMPPMHLRSPLIVPNPPCARARVFHPVPLVRHNACGCIDALMHGTLTGRLNKLRAEIDDMITEFAKREEAMSAAMSAASYVF